MIRKSLGQVLKSLTPVARGDDVYSVANADRINNIQDAIQLITRGDHIIAGDNVRKKSGDGFVMLTGTPVGGTRRGGTARQHFPWETTFVVGGTTIEPIYEIRVRPGTVNGLVPDNIFGGYSVPGAGLYYVKILCMSDGYTVTNITLIANVTANESYTRVSSNTVPPYFYDLISVVQVVDNNNDGILSAPSIYQVRSTNLSAVAKIAFVQGIAPSDIGAEPFIRWWEWQVT